MTVEEMNEVIDKQIKRCQDRSMEISDAQWIADLSHAMISLMSMKQSLINQEECILCRECESRIRYNGKDVVTGNEELKNILQHVCELLQDVQILAPNFPKEKLLYLINGINTVQKVLSRVQ